MISTFRLATLASVTFLALASSSAALAADPASVQAGAYALEPSHTRVAFALDHMGFSTWYGDFSGAKGSLSLDPKNVAGSQLDVTIPTASISTTNTVLDGELKDPTWFDAAKFPTITFHSTKVVSTGADTAKVTGDLTFHGVTKPVTLDVKFHGAGPHPMTKTYTVGFDATGSLKRSDFGVTKYVPIVGDQVTLVISAPFEKKPG